MNSPYYPTKIELDYLAKLPTKEQLEKSRLALIEANIRSAKKFAEQERRAQLLDDAEEQGVGIVHIYNPESPLGGLTIAFSKSNPYASGVMVDVAVNTCSELDSFSKKIGTLGALEKYYAGETIQLPLLTVYAQENIAFAVKHAFSVLYFSIA